MEEIKQFLVEQSGERLDKFLALKLEFLSRTQIQKLIREGNALVNNQVVNCSYVIREQDSITVEKIKLEENLIEEPVTFEVLFEDDYILVINKPTNVIVHPSAGNFQATLINQLLLYAPDVFGNMLDEELRPGIVHRLDKETTGVMIIAKTKLVQEQLKLAFKKRKVKKDYLALLKGKFRKKRDIIQTYYGRDSKHRQKMAVLKEETAKIALTRYNVLVYNQGVSLVCFRLDTGRTHQIRVHCKYLGHCLLGDKVYAKKNITNLAPRQMLHAWRLELYHPVTKENLFFECPPAQDMINCAKKYSINLS